MFEKKLINRRRFLLKASFNHCWFRQFPFVKVAGCCLLVHCVPQFWKCCPRDKQWNNFITIVQVFISKKRVHGLWRPNLEIVPGKTYHIPMNISMWLTIKSLKWLRVVAWQRSKEEDVTNLKWNISNSTYSINVWSTLTSFVPKQTCEKICAIFWYCLFTQL